jgi:hypothetical protein
MDPNSLEPIISAMGTGAMYLGMLGSASRSQ